MELDNMKLWGEIEEIKWKRVKKIVKLLYLKKYELEKVKFEVVVIVDVGWLGFRLRFDFESNKRFFVGWRFE